VRTRLLLPMVLLLLTTASACRQYVIVRLDQTLAAGEPAIGAILVQAVVPDRGEVSLANLDQSVAYHDVAGSMTITTRICSPNKMLLRWQKDSVYTVDSPSSEIIIRNVGDELDPTDLDRCCDYRDNDGHCSTGVGGTGGSAGTGGTPGTGTGGMSGTGGAGAGGDAGGTGGGTATGGADGGLDGGDNADGLCGDGPHDVVTCARPEGEPGPGDVPSLPAVSDNCKGYCDAVLGTADGGQPFCPGSYPSIEKCQRYCMLAGWQAGSNTGDTTTCREYQITKAQLGLLKDHVAVCLSAGPSGGDGCGQPCQNFCNVKVAICGGDFIQCRDSCLLLNQQPGSPDPSCRFSWLLLAASDRRYCPALDFDSMCVLPECAPAPPG